MVIIEKSTMFWVENFEDEKFSFYNETEILVRIFFSSLWSQNLENFPSKNFENNFI